MYPLHRSSRPSQEKIIQAIKITTLLLLVCGAYTAYPYFTLWEISKAIQNHDTTYLARCLNWHSIQNHLKINLTQDFQKNDANMQDDLPEFGNSFAATAISNAIDHHINDSSLHTLLNYISPPDLPDTSPAKNTKSALRIFMSSRVYFSSPLTLHTRIPLPYENAPVLHITMKFQKWQWKITNINLPDQIVTDLFQKNKK